MSEAFSVAFLGLGTMGAPMARNLIEDGFALRVFDVSATALAAFEGSAYCARSPADAARDADVVICMLPDSSFVDAVLFGVDGAVAGMRPGGLVIDMSTGSARATLRLAQRLEAEGRRFVDAPVARGKREAIDGTLIVVAGGAAADVETAMPLFRAMGEQVLHMGTVGSGIRAKLVNNYGSMVNMVIASEMLAFAGKLGLDRTQFLELVGETAAGKGQLLTNFPKKVLAGDISPDFPLLMGLKDLGLALELGADVGMPLWLGGVARELFSLSRTRGRGQDDCTAMLLLLEDLISQGDGDTR
ncbi:NAD(P)-dependent oxidoreductase [Pseudomonas sp.]|jgi:4-hydroxybutyrate dehydrogenase/sulfolactaldehyde 3-reductase|uniref:NAD(P)-dependent oxidoreductase n=1 Tax=Pseudomonas sp. TaxID=306 RepID=UPI0028AF735D|nr:NAD(P)-dependent oxidoreductase [Pseudomonas sp.]